MYSASLKNCLLLALCFCALKATAGSRNDFAVAAIPPALRQNADAVIRQYDEEIEVVSPLEVKVRHHAVITLLHAAAADIRHLAAYSSDLQKLDDIEARLYDAAGEQVKYIRRKDFKTRPMNIGNATYTDVELKEYLVDFAVYPFTIEFSYSVTGLQSFMLPQWSPQGDYSGTRTAVEHASLSVMASPSSGFRYKTYGLDAPRIQHKEGRTEWLWTLASRPASRKELFSVNAAYSSPSVVMSVNQVAVKPFSGSAETWTSLGGFVNELNRGRDKLSDDDKKRVHSLTDQLSTDREKIRVLYKDMQQRMRYVAVEIGVGGWQTIDAGSVGQNQYGDCKGLSNYMMAMLKEAGISAYPVLISAGEDYKPLSRDFPAPYFNHEILCVPSSDDTLWLECTSNDAPAGYLGAFTQDRDALMITQDGGVIVHTPVLSNEQNVLQRSIYATIDQSLVYDMKLESLHSAYWCDKLRPYVQHLADAQLRQFVSNKFTLHAYTVGNYQYLPVDHPSLPVWKETVSMRATALASSSEKRLFLNIDLMPLELPDLSDEAVRSTDFCIRQSYTIADSFFVDVPRDREMEKLPCLVDLKAPFGSYYLETRFESGKVSVYRKFIMQAGNYAAADYPRFITFIEKVKNSGREKVVLRTP